MIHKLINLRPENEEVTLEVLCTNPGFGCDTPPRPAFVVCPGGAYLGLSAREGEPIAMRLIPSGFQGFVLKYSVGEGKAVYPAPLHDVSMAICHIKEHAEEYNVDPDKIFVTGFSAGGHLSAAYGVFWNTELAAFPGMAKGANKPAGVAPCYPVITPDNETGHRFSYSLICGGEDKVDALADSYNPAKNVNDDTVPMFLWHTFDDGIVPVMSSLLMAEALNEKKIPFELHVYPHGAHGMSLANEETAMGQGGHLVNPHTEQWIESLIWWAKEICNEIG